MAPLPRSKRERRRKVSEPTSEPFAREVRRDAIAFATSTLLHGILLAGAAVLFLGGGFGEDEPTVITSTWSESLDEAVDAVEELEIETEITAGGTGETADSSSVVSASSLSVSGAAVATALEAQISGGGLGGAFFGAGKNKTGSYGKRIVYIVDASGSMDYHLYRTSRFVRVQAELERAIHSLDASQEFAVIFFNDQARPAGAHSLRFATNKFKNRVLRAIANSNPKGGTNPKGAIKRALRMKPDTIYFLTDGRFLPFHAAALMKKQEGLTVHTFTLGDSSGEAVMRKLAEANGGSYRFVDGRPQSTIESTAATPGSSNGVGNTP